MNPKSIGWLLIICVSFSLPCHADTSQFNAQYSDDAKNEFNTSSVQECVPNYPCFTVNLDYPESYEVESLPWESISFINEPEKYMYSVLAYAVEGNLESDWNVAENKTREWFHAPWMHRGETQREPVRGLTRERGSRWHELSAMQTRRTRNWAIGFYNDRGGYEFGRVWSSRTTPDTSDVAFPEGTVAIKLLFTDATDVEAPYLAGPGKGLTWYALIGSSKTSDSEPSQPEPLRLLQLDFGVRDKRADDTTGWVFGTFIFDASWGNDVYTENLVPVGLQWGSDPDLTRDKYDKGEKPIEGWVNPIVATQFSTHRPPFGDLGYLGRMNGPVDSPMSSCLACHSRAEDSGGTEVPDWNATLADMCVQKEPTSTTQYKYAKTADCSVGKAAEERIRNFFRNLKTGEAFTPGNRSLDYSLQMAVGVVNWYDWKQENYSAVELRAPFRGRAAMFGGREPIASVPPRKAFTRGD